MWTAAAVCPALRSVPPDLNSEESIAFRAAPQRPLRVKTQSIGGAVDDCRSPDNLIKVARANSFRSGRGRKKARNCRHRIA